MTRTHHFETIESSANGGGPPRSTDWCYDCGMLRREYAGGGDANHPSEYRMGGDSWTYTEPPCPGRVAALARENPNPNDEPPGVIATRLFNTLRAMWEAEGDPFSVRNGELHAFVIDAHGLRERIVADEERQARR